MYSIMNTNIKFKQIHSKCGWHEKAVQQSHICGCFHRISLFPPSEIEEWIDEPDDCPRGPGRTAICPKCGIDAVLPESQLYDINHELLEAMNKEWF